MFTSLTGHNPTAGTRMVINQRQSRKFYMGWQKDGKRQGRVSIVVLFLLFYFTF